MTYLGFKQWIYVIAISFAPIGIIELQKKINENIFGKIVYGYKELSN